MEANPLLLEHPTAINEVARIYGVKARDLVTRIDDCPILIAAANEASDGHRAELVAMAACVAASAIARRKTRAGKANLLKIERVVDPIVRETLYAHEWLGRSIEAIAKDQNLRQMTVKQNLKRGLKIVGL